MPTLDELYPSKYLSAAGLKGKDVTLEIVKVEIEEFEDRNGKAKKPVLHFKNATKTFVCNKTNSKTIGKICGNSTEEWVGNRITLYPTLVDFAGDQVDAIRVKEPPRPMAVESRDAPFDDEVPF